MNKQTFIFPGTFDPITNGHIRLINEMIDLINDCDELCIGVSNSPLKKPILSFNDRYESTRSSINKANPYGKNIIVEKIQGNTAEFINKKNAICLRGIRNLDDLIYESYWPISRSSNHPVESFFLLPLLNENSYQISSTFFKNKIDEFVNKNPKISFEDLYHLLKDIAPYDVVKILYQRKTGRKVFKDIDHNEQIIGILTQKERKNSLLIADYNILDNGYLELMIQAANLSRELIIAIPKFIQHEKIEFSKRLKLTEKIVEKLNVNNIKIIEYDLIFNNPLDLQNLFEQNNIERYFLEVREYHTRNKERLENIFNQIFFLHKNNIKSMIFLQEKYRDFSQPVILQMGHDSFDHERNEFLLKENKKLIDVLPYESIVLLEEYLRYFYR